MQPQNAEQTQDDGVGDEQRVGDHRNLGLAVAALGALGLLAAVAGLVALSDLRAGAGRAVPLLLAAGAAYGLTCVALGRTWTTLEPRARRAVILAIVIIAVAIRLLMLAVPPSLSDDIYRYRWDGRVQSAGLNPYLEPPSSPALAELRDEHWNRINYPRIRTIYPPLTQVLFAATYAVDDSLLSFRVAALLGDLLAMGLLWACLRVWRRPPWLLALYALHPLPAVEFASSGHFDAWAISAVLGALLALAYHRPTLAAALLGAGVLLKTWPLVFVPLLARRWSWRQAAVFVGVIAAGYLPYRDAGVAMAQPWLDYAGRWRFNDGAFWILVAITRSLEAAKAVAAGLGLGLLAVLWRRRADPVAGGYWLLLAFIVLMPTVHPWYMLWALPLAAAAGDRGWATLCALAPLAYTILIGAGSDSDAWVEPVWPRFAQYLPALAIWAWQARRTGVPVPTGARASGSPVDQGVQVGARIGGV